jgi:hypothetical protein
LTDDEMITRILEVELYLTQKLITLRGTGYKPSEEDADQILRDEIYELRKKLNQKEDEYKNNNRR